ncbi:MAG TPA: hypothetical protein VGI74_04475 [Streptosporangiaceae bacterium]|jgi:hypothetical protein
MSRRSLLGAAGVGAAGLAVGALGGLTAVQAATTGKPAAKKPAAASADTKSEPAERANADEHVVIHVRPGRGGELDVYQGTSHVRVHDPDLAARLRQTTR